MANRTKPTKSPSEDQLKKYREAGVEGNDQHAAIRNEGKISKEEILGNAEKSERGTTEFNADLGIEDEKPDCMNLSDNNHNPSDRGQTEFLEEL